MALELQALNDSATDDASASGSNGFSGFAGRFNGVTGKDRMFFTEQLALMLSTGTALHPALLSIANQVDGRMQTVVEEMADGVMNGRSLSEELGRHDEVFSPMYVNLVAASEHGGFLSDVLEQLRAIEEKNDQLRATLISAFSYPAFLVVFSMFTLAFVLLVVFPKFADLFVAIGDQLPGTTKFLMGLSNFLVTYWIETAIATVAGTLAAVGWLKSPPGRRLTDRLKLTAPLVNRVWQRVYVVLLLRVLGLSLQHGVSLVEAVKTSQGAVNNGIVRDFLADLSHVLEQGGRLAAGLAGPDWLPDLVKQMLTTAEDSGSLAPVMLRLSEHYNKELERLLDRFSKMVEPIMLVFMGAMVGLLVSSMILPIFKLSHAVT